MFYKKIMEVEKMDELLNILMELHDDVDYMNETKLIDDGILDSFDIIQLIDHVFFLVIGLERLHAGDFFLGKAVELAHLARALAEERRGMAGDKAREQNGQRDGDHKYQHQRIEIVDKLEHYLKAEIKDLQKQKYDIEREKNT